MARMSRVFLLRRQIAWEERFDGRHVVACYLP
jgi:hypothetical protein